MKRLLKFLGFEVPPRKVVGWTAAVATVLSLMGAPGAFTDVLHAQLAHGQAVALLDACGAVLLLAALCFLMCFWLALIGYQVALGLANAGKGIANGARALPGALSRFMSWLRGIPAAFGRMRARLGKAWTSVGNAYRAVKGMTRQDWLAVGFACLSFAILGAIGWMFWGVAGHISAHLPRWFFGHDSFDRFFVRLIVDWFLSMIPWAFAMSFLSAAVKRTRRRGTNDTKSKK